MALGPTSGGALRRDDASQPLNYSPLAKEIRRLLTDAAGALQHDDHDEFYRALGGTDHGTIRSRTAQLADSIYGTHVAIHREGKKALEDALRSAVYATRPDEKYRFENQSTTGRGVTGYPALENTLAFLFVVARDCPITPEEAASISRLAVASMFQTKRLQPDYNEPPYAVRAAQRVLDRWLPNDRPAHRHAVLEAFTNTPSYLEEPVWADLSTAAREIKRLHDSRPILDDGVIRVACEYFKVIAGGARDLGPNAGPPDFRMMLSRVPECKIDEIVDLMRNDRLYVYVHAWLTSTPKPTGTSIAVGTSVQLPGPAESRVNSPRNVLVLGSSSGSTGAPGANRTFRDDTTRSRTGAREKQQTEISPLAHAKAAYVSAVHEIICQLQSVAGLSDRPTRDHLSGEWVSGVRTNQIRHIGDSLEELHKKVFAPDQPLRPLYDQARTAIDPHASALLCLSATREFLDPSQPGMPCVYWMAAGLSILMRSKSVNPVQLQLATRLVVHTLRHGGEVVDLARTVIVGTEAKRDAAKLRDFESALTNTATARERSWIEHAQGERASGHGLYGSHLPRLLEKLTSIIVTRANQKEASHNPRSRRRSIHSERLSEGNISAFDDLYSTAYLIREQFWAQLPREAALILHNIPNDFIDPWLRATHENHKLQLFEEVLVPAWVELVRQHWDNTRAKSREQEIVHILSAASERRTRPPSLT